MNIAFPKGDKKNKLDMASHNYYGRVTTSVCDNEVNMSWLRKQRYSCSIFLPFTGMLLRYIHTYIPDYNVYYPAQRQQLIVQGHSRTIPWRTDHPHSMFSGGCVDLNNNGFTWANICGHGRDGELFKCTLSLISFLARHSVGNTEVERTSVSMSRLIFTVPQSSI